MAALIYQWKKILGQNPINWEKLWSYYIHYECRSQATQIIKKERRFLSEGSDSGSMQDSNFEYSVLSFKHAYLKTGESDPFPDNSKDCWGRVENKNSVTLTSLYISMKTDDMTAPSEQCQNIWMSSDWFRRAAPIQLIRGRWWVNQGLFCM